MNYTFWQIVALLITSSMVLISAFCVLFPKKLIDSMLYLAKSKIARYADITIRLMLGIAFILIAETARYPLLFTFVGYLSIIAVLAIIVLGTKKLENIVNYIVEITSLWQVRLVCIFSVVLFSFLFYAIGIEWPFTSVPT